MRLRNIPDLGGKFSKNKMYGLLFANDFEGLAESMTSITKFDTYLYTHNYRKTLAI